MAPYLDIISTLLADRVLKGRAQTTRPKWQFFSKKNATFEIENRSYLWAQWEFAAHIRPTVSYHEYFEIRKDEQKTQLYREVTSDNTVQRDGKPSAGNSQIRRVVWAPPLKSVLKSVFRWFLSVWKSEMMIRTHSEATFYLLFATCYFCYLLLAILLQKIFLKRLFPSWMEFREDLCISC